MRPQRYIWLLGLLITTAIIVTPMILALGDEVESTDDPWENVEEQTEAVDHSYLFSDASFETGQDVTAACLDCHPDAASDVMQTAHWTWESKPVEVPGRDEPITTGKANSINNFCIGIQSNWPGCTRCHAGYGWEDETFFETATETQVDCLVCHDQSGAYAKTTAGFPSEDSDLLVAAQSVGRPTRENCGGCHFNGGGGNAVKHGDLDESLYYPDESVDVHMGRYGFQCVDCHQTEDHHIAGRAISVSVETSNQVYCTDCHNEDVHTDERIAGHLDTVACQTCHIPLGATREATKVHWDWSTAGQDFEEDAHEYLKIKGSFVYESNIIPEYGWYNGLVDRYLLGDTIDPSEVTILNEPYGDIDDPSAKIWPFKIHRAMQIYDAQHNHLIQPKTVGEGGYWQDFDWDQAARLGSEVVGLPYSGEYDFAPTEMYWTLSHLVVPADQALQCTDCHGDYSRMDWAQLGYYGDPMTWGGREAE